MFGRFSFLPPSCGDRLLKRASVIKLELHRYTIADPLVELDDGLGVPADEPRETVADLSYELKGELPLRGAEADELLAGLIHEFRQPIGRGKGGAA